MSSTGPARWQLAGRSSSSAHSLPLRSPRSSQPVLATNSSLQLHGVGWHLLPPGRLPR